jgi:crotonobetainyl-CoA:carnitine CoA-transferase CaiB-like acyl-CoA transferase
VIDILAYVMLGCGIPEHLKDLIEFQFMRVRQKQAVGYRLSRTIPTLSGKPRARSTSVPALGQHTREALAWAGLSVSRIDCLASRKVIETGRTDV